MAIVNATEDTFRDEIESDLVLVDFWADWCGPCKMIAPVLEEISAEMGDKLKIVKVNVDENEDLAAEFDIMSIPTMLIYKDGEVVGQELGFQPKEVLVAKLTSYM